MGDYSSVHLLMIFPGSTKTKQAEQFYTECIWANIQ